MALHARWQEGSIVLLVFLGICFMGAGANPITAAASSRPSAGLLRECPDYIQFGDSGPCVIELQRALARSGANVSIDGEFGEKTQSAVERFQRQSGLDVDGVVGPDTKRALSVDTSGQPQESDQASDRRATKAQIANVILRTPGVLLQSIHVSGVRDNANARQNVADTAAGNPAKRSSYQGAPGGTVQIDRRVLGVILALGKEGEIRVSEIAGGSHSSGSRHYSGAAVDIDQYPAGRPQVVVNKCQQFGAELAFFEGGTHVHCEW